MSHIRPSYNEARSNNIHLLVLLFVLMHYAVRTGPMSIGPFKGNSMFENQLFEIPNFFPNTESLQV